VDDFLQSMIENGVTKISALPILYDELEKRLASTDIDTMTYEDLSAISNKLSPPIDVVIIDLPPMTMLSSSGDVDAFWRYVRGNNIPERRPGQHEQFELQDEVLIRVAEDFVPNEAFQTLDFPGGLYATVNVYLDEDLEQKFHGVVTEFDDNKFYEIDYDRTSMLENLLSPDDKRELVALLVPVKKRVPDAMLYDSPQETDMTIAALEAANPPLWSVDVPLDKLKGINNPRYNILDNGEIEYTSWISTRVLSTEVAVKLPYRVDMEWRCERHEGYGNPDGPIVFHHGWDGETKNPLDGSFYIYGNSHARNSRERTMGIHQPIFANRIGLPSRANLRPVGEYNKITWIVGEKYLACILNGEVLYCGENFPYMTRDFSRERALPIVIGSDGNDSRVIKSIRVSQLIQQPKHKIKGDQLTMITKRSNNTISTIHRLITSEWGENFWFNGAARYAMECLGEKDYDYEFFHGITGDIFVPQYTRNGEHCGDGISGYHVWSGNTEALEEIFDKCGYASTVVWGNELHKNPEMYKQTLMAFIDKGVPVIVLHNIHGVFVGYEEHGNTLLYIQGDDAEPKRISFDDATKNTGNKIMGGCWIFVGQKHTQRDLAQLCKDAITALPGLLTKQGDTYAWGAEAFRVWADTLENDHGNRNLSDWGDWGSYICAMATIGSCCHGFLGRTASLNPDWKFTHFLQNDLSTLYGKLADLWNKEGGLESLNAGFNVTPESLQNEENRAKIIVVLRQAADLMDEILRILNLQQDDAAMDAEIAAQQAKLDAAAALVEAAPIRATYDIELAAMKSKIDDDIVTHESGVVTLISASDGNMGTGGIVTERWFNGPIKIQTRIKVNDNHLRLYYHFGALIFRCPDAQELHINDIADSKPSIHAGKGGIPVNEYFDLEWIIGRDAVIVKVNGETQHVGIDYSYIDKLKDPAYELCSPLRICGIKDSTVTIEKLVVSEI